MNRRKLNLIGAFHKAPGAPGDLTLWRRLARRAGSGEWKCDQAQSRQQTDRRKPRHLHGQTPSAGADQSAMESKRSSEQCLCCGRHPCVWLAGLQRLFRVANRGKANIRYPTNCHSGGLPIAGTSDFPAQRRLKAIVSILTWVSRVLQQSRNARIIQFGFGQSDHKPFAVKARIHRCPHAVPAHMHECPGSGGFTAVGKRHSNRRRHSMLFTRQRGCYGEAEQKRSAEPKLQLHAELSVHQIAVDSAASFSIALWSSPPDCVHVPLGESTPSPL